MESPEAYVATAPPMAPRCWRLKDDFEKGFLVSFGTTRPSFTQRLKALIRNFDLYCMVVYRLGQLAAALAERSWLLAAIPFTIYVILDLFVRLVLHVHIALNCRIGPGFHLGHPYTIVIGPTSIGANCNVTHNVTLGMGLGATRRGVPVIGNNVWVGPGATITGPITIGDGATIAPGSVVSKSVPPRALVAGNPARVVQADYDNRELLAYPLAESRLA